MSEEQNNQQAYILGQMRDSMERQVVLMEQYSKDMKASHRRMDALKKELTKFNDGIGEVSAKLEGIRAQDLERNQMLEELGQNKMEELQLQLNTLGNQLDFIKSNGSRQTGWMENVASANLEGIKGGIDKNFEPLQEQQDLLQQLAKHHLEAFPKQMADVIEGIGRLQTQLNPLQEHLTSIRSNQKEHTSTTVSELKQVAEKVASGAANTQELHTWLQHLANENIDRLQAHNEAQQKLQALPFESYQYLWNYAQFFAGTTEHCIEKRHKDWVLLISKGTDLGGATFQRTGWLHTSAPEVVWVLKAYEVLEEETPTEEEESLEIGDAEETLV